MTTVFYGVVAVLILTLGIGIIAPALVSSTSDLGVLAGFLTVVLTGVLEYFLFKAWYRTVEAKIVIKSFTGE